MRSLWWFLSLKTEVRGKTAAENPWLALSQASHPTPPAGFHPTSLDFAAFLGHQFHLVSWEEKGHDASRIIWEDVAMTAAHCRANQLVFCSSIPPGRRLSVWISGYRQVPAVHLETTMSEHEQCHVSAIELTKAWAKSWSRNFWTAWWWQLSCWEMS